MLDVLQMFLGFGTLLNATHNRYDTILPIGPEAAPASERGVQDKVTTPRAEHLAIKWT